MKRLNRESALLAIVNHGGIVTIAMLIAAVYWPCFTILEAFLAGASASLATALVIVVLAKIYKVKL
jgi:hypothetical protein